MDGDIMRATQGMGDHEFETVFGQIYEDNGENMTPMGDIFHGENDDKSGIFKGVPHF